MGSDKYLACDIVESRGSIRSLLISFRDYFLNAQFEIVLTSLGFVSGIVLTRGLGPAGRGQLAAAIMWPSLIAMLVCPGLNQAFAYAVGVGWASPVRLRRFAGRFSLVVGVPAMVGYWLLSGPLLGKQFPGELWVPRIFAAWIPLTIYSGLLLPVFQGGANFRIWNAGRLFQGAAWAIFVAVLWYASSLSVLSLLISQLVIIAVSGFFLSMMISRVSSRVNAGGEAPVGWIYRYGRAIYLSNIAYMVNQQLDQLLLSMWWGPAELGQYATAVSIAGMLLIIPSAIGPILFSKMARSAETPSLRRQYQTRALLLTMALLFPFGSVLVFAGPCLTRFIYGTAFSRAGEVLQILAPATVFLGISNTLSHVLRGIGKPMYATYGLASGVLLTAGGLAWALPRYGIMGAAWVSLVAYFFMMSIQFYFLRKWTTEEGLAAPPTTL